MATRTIADGGGNWNASTTWVENAIPTAADDVVATGTSGALTVNASAACRSFDMTGYTNTVTHNTGIQLSVGDSSGGLFKLVPGMTYTVSGSPLILFAATSDNGGTGWPVSFAGKSVFNLRVAGVGGKWVVQDAGFTILGSLDLRNGILDMNSKNFTAAAIVVTNSSADRTLTFGTSTVTLTSNTPLNTTTVTGLTWTAGSSVLNCSAANATFAGGGLAHGTVRLTGTGTAVVTGANTFTNLERSNAAAVTLTLPAATTTTATTLTLVGIPGKLVTIQSSSGGSAATLSVAAGTVRVNHCSVKDLTGTGGATFEAYDSINVSGNTDISFVAAEKGSLVGVG